MSKNENSIPPIHIKISRENLQSAISHASQEQQQNSQKKLPQIETKEIKKIKTLNDLKNDQKSQKKSKKFSLPSLQNLNSIQSSNQKKQQSESKSKLVKKSSKLENLNVKKNNLKAIKQEILKTFNQARNKVEIDELFQDITLNLIASEMAENFFIYFQNNEQKQNQPIKFKHVCELKIISGNYTFIEQDQEVNDQTLIDATKELINIFFESNSDKQIILNSAYNSCGISIYINEESLRMVVAFAYNPIEIKQIKKDLLGKIKITGKVHDENKGLYAIKIINNETKKQIDIINHEIINFDLQDQEFIISYSCDDDFILLKPPKLLEFYLKDDPSSIKYGHKSKVKHISKQLSVQLYAPLTSFPQVVENKIQLFRTRKSFELKQEIANKLFSGDQKKQQENLNNSKSETDSELTLGDQNEKTEDSESDSSLQSEETQEIEIQNEEDQKKQDEFKENQNLKNELVQAINEASDEMKQQIQINKKLQQVLVQNWEKTGIKVYPVDSQNTDDINEIKYNNCLVLIHQTSKELIFIQERFEKQQQLLNQDLEEKTQTCEQIKTTFMNLKNKMQKNGVISQKKKQIVAQQTEQIANLENLLLKQIQDQKKELIQAKMNFDKNQKKLNSRDQFAEGLHLIDFEKLKIENQSLNEKIEERNEEIFKLKKKNDQSIQIQAHYQEKLIQENQKIEILQKQNNTLGIIKRKRFQKQKK